MGILIAIAALGGIFCYYQNNKIVITDIKVKHNINNKIRIVQISDLHSKEFGKNNNVLYRKIIEQEPDIIVATGDLIDSNMKKLDEIIEFCSRVNKRVPMYYILGNNEMRCSRLNEIIEKLKANNINVLENQIQTIKIKGNIINILGLAEKRIDGGGEFYSKVKSRYALDNNEILFKNLEKLNGIKLVLSHYPENFEYVDEFSYNKYKFDIMFSGHAHGGQFILPVLGGIFAPGQGLFPKYYKGVYGEKNKLVVSRGLGNSGFPLRLFNRPDIVVVDIINK
ncbi:MULTISPECIES: metallophosphoesterase [unclassified Clostridium]|uniref:metallophosphoesterase n=1 Tax=Clostridium TaxID=1485 RepID=UPI001C8B1DF5|nr:MULTISPECIES: metallophosphoesterase [unclassified Clostridium]MBX9137771.1 phosphoesterase [Clostridium sp. K12(2020)]MBX9144604.1 phosphoesterase [Clostridium sp. K13]MDU2289281.1 metallophosphoesterase [Clostridium celatum]MDU4327235.1 metallophosphoesterase [Clostridium celatum]